MDTESERHHSILSKRLQWGHALSGMDTLTAITLGSSAWMLQWGHALSGMDTTLFAWRPGTNLARFNGAMPFQAWIRVSQPAVVEYVEASMGPCPFRHGYNILCIQCQHDIAASMGPCPFRHGYTAYALYDLYILLLLQWGHALSGMDIRRMCRKSCSAIGSFNGAMPFQAWISGRDEIEVPRH